MRDPDWHMEQIRRIAGDDIEGMTPICVVPAMLSYQWRGTWVTNQVQVIGIDEKTQSKVSDFARYLQHPANRQEMSFDLRDGGYDTRDHLAEGPSREREDMRRAGWENRRRMAREQAEQERILKSRRPRPACRTARRFPRPNRLPSGKRRPTPSRVNPAEQVKKFDPSKEQNPGVVLGIAMSNYRKADGEEHFRVLPGEDVQAHLPHGRRAAQGRERQVHDRRFLREQDARIRQHVRLHAHQGVAAAARHDRSFDRRRAT